MHDTRPPRARALQAGSFPGPVDRRRALAAPPGAGLRARPRAAGLAFLALDLGAELILSQQRATRGCAQHLTTTFLNPGDFFKNSTPLRILYAVWYGCLKRWLFIGLLTQFWPSPSRKKRG